LLQGSVAACSLNRLTELALQLLAAAVPRLAASSPRIIASPSPSCSYKGAFYQKDENELGKQGPRPCLIGIK